ncbi:MAG: hypothetical protein ACQER7_08455 [Bacteroidota bacterium]
MKKSTIIILIICAFSLVSFEFIMIKDYLNFLCMESTNVEQKAFERAEKGNLLMMPSKHATYGWLPYDTLPVMKQKQGMEPFLSPYGKKRLFIQMNQETDTLRNGVYFQNENNQGGDNHHR